MSLQSIILVVVKISIILTVLGFALNVKLSDVTFFLREPGKLVRSLLAMNVIMPAFAAFMALLLPLDPPVKIALVALSVSPVPPILPGKEIKSGGNASYAYGLLGTMAILSVVLIPLTLALLDRVFHITGGISIAAIFRTVLVSVLLPLAIGVTLRELKPLWAEKLAKPISITARTLLILGFLPILLTSFKPVIALIGNGTLLAMVAFVAVALLSGHFLGGPEKENRIVLALSTSARHPGVAIAIAQMTFPDQIQAPLAVVLYLIVNAVASIPYVKKFEHLEGRQYV